VDGGMIWTLPIVQWKSETQAIKKLTSSHHYYNYNTPLKTASPADTRH